MQCRWRDVDDVDEDDVDEADLDDEDHANDVDEMM